MQYKSVSMKRNLLLLTACLFSVILLSAQIKSPFTSIRPQLEKVINDYPNQFSSIKGNRNEGDPNTIQYGSTVEMKGAVESKVIGYPTKTKINWLCEAKLFITDDMAELKKQYKSVYNDIAGKSFMSKGANNSINATGPYSAPSEELRLWTNQFRINDVTGEFGNLVIDLVAEYANFEWIVYVRIYDKEKDEDMKPTKDKNEKYRY